MRGDFEKQNSGPFKISRLDKFNENNWKKLDL